MTTMSTGQLFSTAILSVLLFSTALTASSADEEGYMLEPIEETDIDGNRRIIERLMVVGSKENRFSVPGSATYIGEEDLQEWEYQDILRILRLAPGVNIQEEDGFGLRPNIGLRGTSVDRSEKITLMEDGVLIAPAPYAAPAAYYFPTAGRMEAVEVRKGSSAIKFGPRTIGGAINLVSRSIPDDWSGFVDFRLGEHDLLTAHAMAGGSIDNFGLVAETFQSESDGFKNLDGGGNTGFDVEDYLAKFRLNTDEDAALYQSLEIKLSKTDNDSNETYLGLTDADFAATPFRRYAASQLDNINTEHEQIQVTHYARFSDSFDLTTVGYYNDFFRDWFKLDDLDFGDSRGRFRPTEVFENPAAFQDVLAVLRGEANSPDDALQLRHNARNYYSWGLQSVAGIRFETGNASHELEVSLRWHEDEEDRLQNRENFRMDNAVLVRTSVDPEGSQANRESRAQALAGYLQDEIEWNRLRIVAGLRFEEIDLIRNDFSTSDPDRSEGPTRVRKNDVSVIIPGIGIFYDVTERMTLLAGVHKGFSPPGTGDVDADEEESINYEAGFLYNDGATTLEAIAFYNDVTNILGTCTNAVGCTEADIGDQFNGGAVDVIGLELTGGHRFETTWSGVFVPIDFNYTFTSAKFATSFSDSFWGAVSEDDFLPYIPRHQFYIATGLEGGNWGALISANYVGEIRTEAGQGPIPRSELVDSRIVFDLAAHWQITRHIRLFGEIQNLFDNSYAVARRPYGLRPGKPQTAIGGLTVSF